MAEPTSQLDGEPEQGIYDDRDSALSNPKTNLKALEDGDETTTPEKDYYSNTSGNAPSQKDLSGAENDSSSGGQPGNLIGQGNRRNQPKSNRFSLGGRLTKKPVLFGGVLAVLISLLVSFLLTVSYELVHIEKNLLKEEAKLEQRFENKAAQKLMNSITKRAQNKAASKASETPGEPLAADIDAYPLETEASALERQGITPKFDASGNLTSLNSIEGVDVKGNIDDATFSRVETALPEWETGQKTTYIAENASEAGVLFGVYSGSSDDNVKQTLENAVEKGANPEQITSELAQSEDKPPDPNDPSYTNNQSQYNTDNQEYQTQKSDSAALNDGINSVQAGLANGESSSAALADGISAFDSHLGSGLFASYIATTACYVKNTVSSAAANRVPQLITLLIRHGNLLLTTATQLQLGKVSGSEINQTMQIINGDSAAKPNSNGQSPEAALHFDNSAAWQRVTGGVVDNNPQSPGYTPDISKSVIPSRNSATNIVDEIDNAMSSAKVVNPGCKALTGKFGFFIQGVLGLGQIVADAESFGTTQVVILAANTAFQYTLNTVILPDVLKYFTIVGINGVEDGVQWLNNSDAGLNLSYNNYSRRLGADSLTNQQASTLSQAATQSQIAADKRMSLFARLFSPDNSLSLTSRLLNKSPVLSASSLFSGVGNWFTNFGSSLVHSFSSIFSPHAALAANTNGNPYGITQYAFTDSDVNKYDPIANEQYLYSTITYNGKSAKRIDMLGNPVTYQDSPAGDPNHDDLLHCFVDSYTMLADTPGSTNPNKQNCGTLGTYDYSNDDPTNLPSDSTVVGLYCNNLAGSYTDKKCLNNVGPQVNDDVTHFRQYILDTYVMKNYDLLAGNNNSVLLAANRAASSIAANLPKGSQ